MKYNFELKNGRILPPALRKIRTMKDKEFNEGITKAHASLLEFNQTAKQVARDIISLDNRPGDFAPDKGDVVVEEEQLDDYRWVQGEANFQEGHFRASDQPDEILSGVERVNVSKGIPAVCYETGDDWLHLDLENDGPETKIRLSLDVVRQRKHYESIGLRGSTWTTTSRSGYHSLGELTINKDTDTLTFETGHDMTEMVKAYSQYRSQ